MKKAKSTSHTTSLLNPLKASAKVKVFVKTETVNDKSAITPIEKGLRMTPIIVAVKIANSRHASIFTPSGSGMNQRINPINTEIVKKIAFFLFTQVIVRKMRI